MPSQQIPNSPKLINETVIPIQDVRKILPGTPSPFTIERWMRTGVSGVLLESFCVGRKRFTSREAVTRFIEEINRCSMMDELHGM